MSKPGLGEQALSGRGKPSGPLIGAYILSTRLSVRYNISVILLLHIRVDKYIHGSTSLVKNWKVRNLTPAGSARRDARINTYWMGCIRMATLNVLSVVNMASS